VKARIKNTIYSIKESTNGTKTSINGTDFRISSLKFENNKCVLEVNGRIFICDFILGSNNIEIQNNDLGSFTVEFPSDALLSAEKLAELSAAKSGSGKVKALMPGLVSKIMIQNGQEVQEGESLFILEAMKMENVVLSTSNGIISSINVAEGSTVSKGDLIMEIE
jgi:biotin carboxyl carrier protein